MAIKEYLNQHDWDPSLPDWLSPELMMGEHIIVPPERVLKILERAKRFLIQASGPNKYFRSLHVPSWFDSWRSILGVASSLGEYERKGGFVVHPGMLEWSQISSSIAEDNACGRKTGFVSMAGGEGRLISTHLYLVMRRRVRRGE